MKFLEKLFLVKKYYLFFLIGCSLQAMESSFKGPLELEIKRDIYIMFVLEMGIKSKNWPALSHDDKSLEKDLKELYSDLQVSDEKNGQMKLDEFCNRWKLNSIKINDVITNFKFY